MDELKRRVDRLETQNRRLGAALLALLLLLCGLLLVGASPGKGRGRGPLLRARALHVLDSQGRVRIKLTTESGKPALIMLGEQGQLRSVQCATGWARYDDRGRAGVRAGRLECLPAEQPAKKPGR